MTDARLPDKWLGDPRFEDLEPETWTFFTKCLMWSNRYGTDGVIPIRYASRIIGSGNLDFFLMQLEASELAKKDRHNIFFPWDHLGQSTAAEVEDRRRKNRIAQAEKRLRDLTKSSSVRGSKYISNDVSADISPDVGQGRLGQEGYIKEYEDEVF